MEIKKVIAEFECPYCGKTSEQTIYVDEIDMVFIKGKFHIPTEFTPEFVKCRYCCEEFENGKMI